ncbi:hypothetical protein SAMN05444380_10137 [Thermophagus xiamenensis]|uniref:Uncharacterized protein n=1 Tax=Thermophagus xiamenensis TaxID=385682 RepID=A0A1I1ULM9_9BACT|nr:hypothetical protein SAMN05444380_10137 [Thermophagus xiamenensis]
MINRYEMIRTKNVSTKEHVYKYLGISAQAEGLIGQ